MKIKKLKLLKKVGFTILAIAIVLFTINWYMKSKLERYLREKLTEQIAQATGGFYQFHSEHLDIGLFNGELTLKGVVLRPDSTLFKQWAANDSLPQNYFDIEIERIHFKGLNLIWLFSYRQLHFDLFEIQKPIIKVIESKHSSRIELKTKNKDSKTLYETISPYIDVLTVQKMNLENASITYVTDDQGMPAIYGLENVSFHAYGFVLDKNSDQSGKLLLCDDFDFTTNQPQVLLSNNQFLLQTDSIRLSTKDSIIQIKKVHLQPQTLLWEQQHTLPDTYLEARVHSIEVKGVRFKRENAVDYLEAATFDINKSDIQYFNVEQDTITAKPERKVETKDTLNLSWTLYAIVSPILHSISIDKIGIGEARLKYTNVSKDAIDIYHLDRFNFEAYGFRVDSLADIQQRFLYSQGFSVDAADIEGIVASQNHAMSIGRMKLNTVTKDFHINNVKLSPLMFNTQRDYMLGTIDSIRLSEWEYDKGLRAGQLSIDAPRIEYVKMHTPKKRQITEGNDKSANLDMVVPFFNHVSIHQVNLNNGNIVFQDKTSKDNIIYKLPKIDFYASNFLINEATIKHSRTYFASDNLRFSFERFDNLLPGKDYRLMIRKGVYTGVKGNLELYDVKLLPQKETWKKAPDTYFSVLTPFVAIRHIDYKVSEKENTVMFNSFNLESPDIQIVKTRNSTGAEKKGVQKTDKTLSFIAGLFDISNAKIEYSDQTNRDSLKTTVGNIQMKSLAWDADMKNTSIGEITVQSPIINYSKRVEGKSQSKATASKPFAGSLNIGKIGVSDIQVGINQPSLKLHFATTHFDILDIKWNSQLFNLSSVDIAKPVVKVNQISKSEPSNPTSSEKQSIYNMLGGLSEQISVNKFTVSEANIDYASTLNGKLTRQQKLNTTNLFFSGLVINNELKTFALDDINLSTRNFQFPLSNGFYTLQAEAIDLKKNEGSLKIEKLHLIPAYSKQEFAYRHPRNKDWFDVSVGRISLSGIDFSRYFASNIFHAKELAVKDVVLLNFKNQQIEIQHNIMPMIYEELQKFPVQLDIDTANVDNFKVVYEELPKKATTPAVILFTNMNGRLSGVTNIVSEPQQYIRLDADGNLMGTGHFTATWMLPVDSLNDHFFLKAHLNRFELVDLNPLITPMMSAKVDKGHVKSMTFSTNASSKGATIEMLMLYNDLDISVLKNKDGELTTNSFISTIANKVIKSNNPNKVYEKPRHVHVTIERDPYHSTFNYLWQILQPAVVESVGFSQKQQNFAKKVTGFINKVKNIFRKEKKEIKKEVKGATEK